MLERVVSSFAGVGGFDRSSCVVFGGVELAECFRPKEKALPVDFRENFDVPFGGTAGSDALFFPLGVCSACAFGSEEADETALRREELSAVETVFELEVPLPLHSCCQPLTGRRRGGLDEERKGMRKIKMMGGCAAGFLHPWKMGEAATPAAFCQVGQSPVYPKIKIKIAKYI